MAVDIYKKSIHYHKVVVVCLFAGLDSPKSYKYKSKRETKKTY